MSTPHADHAHGHGSSNGDHVPHVLPMWVYLATWGTLLFLTIVTVAASYVNLGHTGNIIVALLIATIKATTVSLVFMHLKWDHKFHSIIFVSSLLFLAVFIGITMSDTQFRGEIEEMEHERPINMKAPFEGQAKGDHAMPAAAPESSAAAAPAAGSAAPAAGSAAPAVVPAKH